MKIPGLAGDSVIVGIPVICGLLLAASITYADWPSDDEDFGIMGCKFFKFKGYWEHLIDTVEPDESIEGACLTVAVASIINHHRWPNESRFDGEYSDCAGLILSKPIDEKWAFELISGNKKTDEDCTGDKPEGRSAPSDPERTGLSEIRSLLYAVERSFGYHHECFRTTEEECGGTGYIPVQHILRNRFGYPLSTALPAAGLEGKKKAIENISSGYPIIALKCDHAYIIDGHRIAKSSGKRLFHVCDYIMSEHSTGWFTWKELQDDGLYKVVVDIKPTVLLRRGPSARTVRYEWGEGRLPSTAHSKRLAGVRISGWQGKELGRLGIDIRIKTMYSNSNENTERIYSYTGMIRDAVYEIPVFEFDIDEAGLVDITVRNADNAAKQVHVEFFDFRRSSEGNGVKD